MDDGVTVHDDELRCEGLGKARDSETLLVIGKSLTYFREVAE